MTKSTKRLINVILIILWVFPLFVFVPCSGDRLAPEHKFFPSLHGSFSLLNLVIGYSSFASLTYDKGYEKYRLSRYYSNSKSKYEPDFVLNPYWKYWFVIVAFLLAISFYLRRDILFKIHNATKPE